MGEVAHRFALLPALAEHSHGMPNLISPEIACPAGKALTPDRHPRYNPVINNPIAPTDNGQDDGMLSTQKQIRFYFYYSFSPPA